MKKLFMIGALVAQSIVGSDVFGSDVFPGREFSDVFTGIEFKAGVFDSDEFAGLKFSRVSAGVNRAGVQFRVGVLHFSGDCSQNELLKVLNNPPSYWRNGFFPGYVFVSGSTNANCHFTNGMEQQVKGATFCGNANTPGLFANCTELRSITFYSDENTGPVTRLPSRLCEGCTALTTLILPDTVEVIDERCFAGCCNLKRVVFKNPCTAVYRDAFSGCDSLDEDSKSALNDHIYNIW